MCVRCGTGRVAWCTSPDRHASEEVPFRTPGIGFEREPGPGGVWRLMFSIRKDPTARMFSIDAVENASRIAAYENVPSGWRIDPWKAMDIQWADVPTHGMAGVPAMVCLHVTCYLKEATDGTE